MMVAPPGFGKTTLLGQWNRSDARPFAWLSLDAADDDPVVLWTYMTAAVASALGAEGQRRSEAKSPALDIEAVVPKLVSALAALDEDVVVVVEDLHWITNPVSVTTLTRFMKERPPNVTVALSARSDPRLPLGELRVSLDLLELGASDLGFTREETERLLNDELDLGLGPVAVRSLWARTEGWPAALYLAYLSLRGAEDRDAAAVRVGGSTRRVGEYLTQVVLEAQDARTQQFLLTTSILDRLTGPLCDAVLDTEGSGAVLAELARANLLIVPLDDERRWYRYHRLFRELLLDELQRRQPGRVVDLHRRAFRWLSDAGLTGEAIRHALDGGDVDAAAMLVSENYLRMLESGRLATLDSWIATFPRRGVIADARLSVVEAWIRSFQGRYAEADLAMGNAARAGFEGPLPDGASSIEASAALLRASAPRGDVGAMLDAARTAFRLESGSASMWQVTTHVQLGWALLLSGGSAEAKPLLERAAVQAPMSEQWLNALGARCLLAWAELEQGRVPEAERWASDAVQVAGTHRLAGTATGAWADGVLGAVRAAQGRLDDADELLTRSVERMRGSAPPVLLTSALLALAPVRRARGSAADARALLEEARSIVEPYADPGVLRAHLERVARSLTPTRRRVSDGIALTERELEVLQLLERGMSKRDIARTLFLSPNTIHSHTKTVYRKLGASSRSEAVQRARQTGLL